MRESLSKREKVDGERERAVRREKRESRQRGGSGRKNRERSEERCKTRERRQAPFSVKCIHCNDEWNKSVITSVISSVWEVEGTGRRGVARVINWTTAKSPCTPVKPN